MKTIIGIIFVIVFCFGVVDAGPLGKQPQVTVVSVNPGDTIWKIAVQHSTERQDVRDVVAAIRYLNGLGGNGQIYPGQTLKIPKPNLARN